MKALLLSSALVFMVSGCGGPAFGTGGAGTDGGKGPDGGLVAEGEAHHDARRLTGDARPAVDARKEPLEADVHERADGHTTASPDARAEGDGRVPEEASVPPPDACHARSCKEEGIECGYYKDNCGVGHICGSCQSQACVAGKCVCTPGGCTLTHICITLACCKQDGTCGCTGQSGSCD